MKLTKSQIKKIIKEELTVVLNEDSAADQRAISLLEDIVLAFSNAYKSLAEGETQELFEALLEKILSDPGALPLEPTNEPEQMVIRIKEQIDAARLSLADSPDSQEVFERFLEQNIKMYTERWQEERSSPGWEAEIEDEDSLLERKYKIKLSKSQLKRIIKEAYEDLTAGSPPYVVERGDVADSEKYFVRYVKLYTKDFKVIWGSFKEAFKVPDLGRAKDIQRDIKATDGTTTFIKPVDEFSSSVSGAQSVRDMIIGLFEELELFELGAIPPSVVQKIDRISTAIHHKYDSQALGEQNESN